MYEGHSAQTCVLPIRIMRCLGVRAVVITNASGGLHPDWDVGTIVSMHDHLSLPTLGVSAVLEMGIPCSSSLKLHLFLVLLRA